MKPDESTAPAVELRGVRKGFGARTILAGIDLSIARGEVLVLVGPSGSGKSTLLKIVSGIETPDAGEVWLSGRSCTQIPAYRRPVHTVFQNYALFPHLDVAGNVAFPLAVAGISRARREELVAEALAWVQMRQHARRRVDLLSGGERQRVALARALVDRPECVLLDEPLSALDPQLRSATFDLLVDLQTRLGLTYLYVTHDRDEALRMGHRIGVLNRGRLEQLGTPQDLYHDPRTPFVASLLGKMNWLSAELTIDGNRREVAFGEHRLSVECRESQAAGPARIGIRPEDLRIAPAGRLRGRVAGRTFAGDTTTIRVATDDGACLLVDQRPASAASVGEAVWLDWAAADMHVFPAGQEDAP
ncbi:MAG: ABC transporter ATP-binding protein [Pirellulaceae bacterium]